MVENSRDTRGDLVDERGVTLTAEGRERARRQLAEADARHTPAEREQMRQAFLTRLDAA
ncbi:MAG TPA: hypothetical protein VFC00_23255 [Micromonosporaceae bacterium]|nr:hypothetical protein [Micromonosporaceae bacterium]